MNKQTGAVSAMVPPFPFPFPFFPIRFAYEGSFIQKIHDSLLFFAGQG